MVILLRCGNRRVKEPQATFSALVEKRLLYGILKYAEMLSHGETYVDCWLVNTGWAEVNMV